MSPFPPWIPRVAAQLETRLTRSSRFDLGLGTLLGEVAGLGRLARRAARAQTRGWRLAAAQIDQHVERQFRQVECSLEIVRRCRASAAPRLSHGELLKELVALDREFESVEFDRVENSLSVITAPIELEGVWLGPFMIELKLARFPNPDSFRAVAQDPQPAASDSEVTHPHVRCDKLCAGDGQQAIYSALQQGRLLDFFLLVRQVLQTYGAESAYVRLDRWHDGEHCGECGSLTDDDEMVCRGLCANSLCSSCESYCEHCEYDRCGECTLECPACGDRACLGCLDPCSACEERVCPRCRNDLNCELCHAQPTESDTAETPSTEAICNSASVVAV